MSESQLKNILGSPRDITAELNGAVNNMNVNVGGMRGFPKAAFQNLLNVKVLEWKTGGNRIVATLMADSAVTIQGEFGDGMNKKVLFK